MRKISSSVKCSLQLRVQRARRVEVVAERLLDDEARPALRAAALADLLDERRDRARRHGEVVEAVASGAALLVELRRRGRAGGPRPPRRRTRSRCSASPRRAAPRRRRGTGRARAASPPPPSAARKSSSVSSRARDADDRELLGQQLPVGERVERGDQLALRQVARGAEDHEDARVRRPPELEPFEERVLSAVRDASFALARRGRRTRCGARR